MPGSGRGVAIGLASATTVSSTVAMDKAIGFEKGDFKNCIILSDRSVKIFSWNIYQKIQGNGRLQRRS